MEITASEVMAKLRDLNLQIDDLLDHTMHNRNYSYESDENVVYGNTPDDRLIRSEIREMLDRLLYVNQELAYLKRPIAVEGKLHKNERGRYELGNYEFTCGAGIEILIEDGHTGKKNLDAHSD